jgi:antitoxin ParD1/3/4
MTSISLDPDSSGIVERQLASGRFGDASDVVRASLRLLDAEDARLAKLRAALQDGESDQPLTGRPSNLFDLLAMPGQEHVEFEPPPRSKARPRDIDFG